MHIPKKVKFRNYVYPIILALFCILFIFLAKWQVKRAHEKELIQQQLSARLKLMPVEIINRSHIDAITDRFLPIILHGKYLNQYNFLLDNQQLNRQPGYKLLTPFQLDHNNKIVLINRGWMPRGISRKTLPIIEASTENTLIGYINTPVSGRLIGENIENDIWPIVLQTIDFKLMASKLDGALEDYVVQLTPIDYIGIGSSKHWGYAVQWAALAVTSLVYLIFLLLKWN